MVEQTSVEFEACYPPAETWFEIHAYPARDGVSVYFRDINERKQLEEQLRRQAFHDALTDLPNRALFLDRLEHALARAEHHGRRIGVLFLDLDNFKVVNDSLRHETGDRLLVMVAERLKGCLRSEDTATRFGGDEFTVLLEEVADEDAAIAVAERIAQTLRVPLRLDGHEVFPGCSIGIALAKSLNPAVTAEGIETAEQLAELRRLGCEKGQGYYFARPLPAAELAALLAAGEPRRVA